MMLETCLQTGRSSVYCLTDPTGFRLLDYYETLLTKILSYLLRSNSTTAYKSSIEAVYDALHISLSDLEVGPLVTSDFRCMVTRFSSTGFCKKWFCEMFQPHLSMYDAPLHKTEARTYLLRPPSIKKQKRLKHFCKSWGLSYFYLAGKLRALAGCAPRGDMWFQTLNTLRNTPVVVTLWNTKIFSTYIQISDLLWAFGWEPCTLCHVQVLQY